jgi:hypothetical protein
MGPFLGGASDWLRSSSSEQGADPPRLKAQQLVWVFCSGRTGSTWLASMLGDLPGAIMWNEPLLGQLFGHFYYLRNPHKRGSEFVMGDPHRDLWMGWIRRIALERAAAEAPNLPDDGVVVVKEPHGTTGAPLLSEALPGSRYLMLVRDPRDVVASAWDAQESWASRRARVPRPRKKSRNPKRFARHRAEVVVQDFEKAQQGFDSHQGPKAFLRYEDLRSSPIAELTRVCRELELDPPPEAIERVVEKYAWENVPEEEKGSGKFHRKATPGGWREDLPPDIVRAVEEIAADLLDRYYPGWRTSPGEREAPAVAANS